MAVISAPQRIGEVCQLTLDLPSEERSLPAATEASPRLDEGELDRLVADGKAVRLSEYARGIVDVLTLVDEEQEYADITHLIRHPDSTRQAELDDAIALHGSKAAILRYAQAIKDDEQGRRAAKWEAFLRAFGNYAVAGSELENDVRRAAVVVLYQDHFLSRYGRPSTKDARRGYINRLRAYLE